jgi:hypothetical protein
MISITFHAQHALPTRHTGLTVGDAAALLKARLDVGEYAVTRFDTDADYFGLVAKMQEQVQQAQSAALLANAIRPMFRIWATAAGPWPDGEGWRVIWVVQEIVGERPAPPMQRREPLRRD